MADDKGLPGELTALKNLVVAYVKQETVGPLKGLGRFVAFGLAGSAILSIGTVLLVLAALRAMQTETTVFGGNWSWAPYFLALILAGAMVALAARAITKGGRKKLDAAEKGTR